MTPVMCSVTFRKQVSDGSYGTEAAEVHLSAELDPEDSEAGVSAELLILARRLVHGELAGSPSIAVRRALQHQEPAPKRDFTPEDSPF